ncbi:AAA family ATPase [Actinoplanes sp. NPDC048988]|uniref:helix-turn-helix transcriptional regulator n=1 Tax=Actinoplanes sp. NPDC048988 TaxID=3363901 RepID=UPI00370F8962
MIGRETELAFLAGVLDDARSGGRVVVLEGDAGVGKTTVVDAVMDEAERRGLPVLLGVGVEGPAPVGYTGLFELLDPILGTAGDLPERQRAALLSALGVSEGPRPDPLLVGLATLGLLEAAAGDRGLLLVVEDLPWLDPSSRAAVTFVAGHRGDAPIMMLATARTGLLPAGLPGATTMTLAPLGADAAVRLLTATAPELGDALRERVLAEAGGNPLALREFAAEADRLPWAEDAERLPVSRRLERALLGDLAALPAASRALLLIAAANDERGTVPEIVEAGRRAGAGPGDLQPLERNRLVRLSGDRLAFDHPLVRSAVYGAATTTERAAAHGHLAEVVADPVRAAWHRAAATLQPDETVARELETASALSQKRGTLPEAVAALRRAAVLSPTLEDRARRLTTGAEVARQAGLPEQSYALLTEALPIAATPHDVAGLATVERLLAMTFGTPVRNVEASIRLAASLGDGPEDTVARIRFLTAAVGQWWNMDGSAETAGRLRAAVLDLVAEGLWQRDMMLAMVDPAAYGPAVRPRLTAMLSSAREAAFAKDTERAVGTSRLLPIFARCSESLQDLDLAWSCWEIYREYHSAASSLGDEAYALNGRGMIHVLRGDLDAGLADTEQALRLAEGSGLTRVAGVAAAVSALAHAWRDDREAAEQRLADSVRYRRHEPYALITARESWAAGLLALRAGRPGDAWLELAGVAAHPSTGLWALSDVAEAGVRGGHAEQARRLCAEAAEQAAALGSDHLWAIVHRARALVTDGDGAEEDHTLSIARAEASGNTFELARSRLAYGEWLRRRRRIAPARDLLAAALREFARAGAAWPAERASLELRAAGAADEAERTPSVRTAQLTPQESQVARLAAAGLTNREIADQMYLSPRTVGVHLYKAFPKLGVTSRTQLQAALA